jgi:hypothetical protein
MFRKTAIASALMALPLMAQPAALVDFTSDNSGFIWYGNNSGCEGGCVLGFTFSLSAPVSIDGLGVYDAGFDGLVNTHQVGLWTSGGSLLASTSAGPGSSGEASAAGGGYRYGNVSPVTLGAGTYIVAALYQTGHTDPVVFQAGGIFSNVGGASYVDSAWGVSSVLQLPVNTSTGATDRYFGPTE